MTSAPGEPMPKPWDPRLCADCLIRPHTLTCWRCQQCQTIHEHEMALWRERVAPRPPVVP